MLRPIALCLLLVAVSPLCADDRLPPGALLRLGDGRFRAGGPVVDLAFTADGSELTSRVPAGDLERVTTWDSRTGSAERSLVRARPAGGQVRWANAAIPDTTRGLVIGPDGVARVRDYEANRDLVRLTGHFARVTAVAASPDGKLLATASEDGLIRVWDAATFRPLAEPTGHTGPVRWVEVSPDGRLALTTGADRSARLWSLATGKELRVFAASGESPATFTTDGTAVRIPEGRRTVTRDPLTGLEVVSSRGSQPEPFPGLNWVAQKLGVCGTLSPDGRALILGSAYGVEVYELASGQVRRRLSGHRGGCLDVAVTADGSRLLTAGADHGVLVWGLRLRDVPMPEDVRRETSAAKLWDVMTAGPADAAYLAMARLAADPPAVAKMARLRLKPNATAGAVADVRAVELLEAVGTAQARMVLEELAGGDPGYRLTREAREALGRVGVR